MSKKENKKIEFPADIPAGTQGKPYPTGADFNVPVLSKADQEYLKAEHALVEKGLEQHLQIINNTILQAQVIVRWATHQVRLLHPDLPADELFYALGDKIVTLEEAVNEYGVPVWLFPQNKKEGK